MNSISTHTIPFASTLRSNALRDLAPAEVVSRAVTGFAVGIAAGWIGASLPRGASGSAHIILEYDRTVGGILVILLVFSLIQRLHADMDARWLLQITAAGQSRSSYILAVAACSVATCLILYAATIAAFGMTMSLRGGDAGALHRFPADMVGCILMLMSASGFACAVGVTSAANATTLAAGVIAMPWLIMLTSIVTRGIVGVPVVLVRVAHALPPRTFMDLSLRGISHQLMYLGITGSIAIYFGNASIGRER